MALGTFGSTLNDELNRLANGGTYRDMDDMVDEALAAKQWANRENINPYSTDTVGILNEIAGLGLDKRNWLDFNGVCNYIAGTTGLPAAAALRQVYATTDLLTGVASYYVDAAYPTGLTSTPGYVYLNGTAGNYISTPDTAALSVTGDIDIRAQVALDDWTPSASMDIVTKWLSTTNNRSFIFGVQTDGTLRFLWTSDGISQVQGLSTVATGFTDGTTRWIRVTFDVNNGASGKDIKFFTSIDGTTWTQLGSTVTTAGTTSIFDGTASVEIGSANIGTANLAAGKFYRAQILNGIDGTVVFDANMSNVSQTATSFTATTGQTVTINGFRAYPQDAANLGAAGSLLPTTLGSSTAADSNDPKFLDHTGTNYVYLPGATSNNMTVPDSAALDITGDIDLRVQVALDDWTPASPMALINKWFTSTGLSYLFLVRSNGTLGFVWSDTGTYSATLDKSSTVATGFVDGTSNWVRVTRASATGTIQFFTSTNGTTWTQLGTDVSSTAGNIFASTSTVEFGTQNSGGPSAVAGKYFRAQIFNGIDGTKVLDVDTSTLQTGADAYIVPVTYSGAAGARFTGSGLALPGTTGNYAFAPDSSALDVTGDIDLRCKVALDDWTPGAGMAFISKWQASGQFSYLFTILGPGQLYLATNPTGSSGTLEYSSTAANTFTDGTTNWVRVTLDVNNGAGGSTAKFYTSADGTNWTQLGSDVTKVGTTSIFAGTSILEIGTRNLGTIDALKGTIYQAQVLNGIDGTVAFNANFEGVPADSLRMTESSSNAAVVSLVTTRYCTINRGTSGRKTVAVTQPTWLFGTDDYMEVNNRYMAHSGTNYLYLPGVASNSATTPDSAAISITGDLDLRIKVALDDWTPGAINHLITKRVSATNQQSFFFQVNTNGTLQLWFYPDGTTANGRTSTVATGIADGATKWVRVTLDVNNGAGGNDTKFWLSDDGTTWTQLGTTVTGAGTTSIFDSTADLAIGVGDAGSLPARGKFFRAQVLNGIDGTVAFDANFETSITSLNQASFTESSANAATVTINRSGSTYRSAGITAAGYLYPGATNTFAASATDFLNFGAADSFTVMAIVRRWATQALNAVFFKKGSDATATPGYGILTTTSTADRFVIAVSDGTAQTAPANTTYTSGPLTSLFGIRDVATDAISAITGSSTVSSTDTTTGTLSTVEPLRIGRFSGSGTSYADMEFIAGAVFRQALTTRQINQISNYFARREAYL